MSESVRVGTLVFEMAFMGVRKRGKREIREPVYQCPECTKRIFGSSIGEHVASHARRDEKSDKLRDFRELGCTAKPAPGQLGFDVFGVREVRK